MPHRTLPVLGLLSLQAPHGGVQQGPEAEVGSELDSWRPFASIVLAYLMVSVVLGGALGWDGIVLHPDVALGVVALGFALLIVSATVLVVARSHEAVRNGHRWSAAPWYGWCEARGDVARLCVRLFALLFSAALVSAIFTGWRVSIPTIHPFAWDRTLDALDLAIHGERPWRLTHALLNHRTVAAWLPSAVDWFYSQGWYFANIALILVLSIRPVGPRGQRVLVAYVLQYAILGSLVAVVVSSAGPVYYGRAVHGGDDPYAGLVPSLIRLFPPGQQLEALQYQDFLWRKHLANDISFTTGITAFPSIHVSSAVLLALAAGSWRRWAGHVGWLAAGLTVFGSVALGWHYAVDAYASILAMFPLWWLAGRLTRQRSANV